MLDEVYFKDWHNVREVHVVAHKVMYETVTIKLALNYTNLRDLT